MYQSHVFLTVFILQLASFETSLSQQECQAQVVVTSQTELSKQIREEIFNAFESFTNVSVNTRIADTPKEPDAATGRQGQDTATDRPHEDRDRPDEDTGPDEHIAFRIENKLDAIKQELDIVRSRLNILNKVGLIPCNAASSCSEILETDPASLSGYYWVSSTSGHPHRVYCDMTRSCGGVAGGWMRVAYLDMTNSSHQCPSGLRQRIDSSTRSCAPYSDEATCSSVLHRANGIRYSRVCGKIHGFQSMTVDGFESHGSARGSTLDSNYVDGVSLTHGENPRQHIWTFAAGLCTSDSPPAFVGNNYFKDGVNANPMNLGNPLWDGEGCGSNTCCHHNNPPWFHKQLPLPTTDDIEMRVCRDQEREDEDVAIEVVEIYVK